MGEQRSWYHLATNTLNLRYTDINHFFFKYKIILNNLYFKTFIYDC